MNECIACGAELTILQEQDQVAICSECRRKAESTEFDDTDEEFPAP